MFQAIHTYNLVNKISQNSWLLFSNRKYILHLFMNISSHLIEGKNKIDMH